jgi:hypothetical protein
MSPSAHRWILGLAFFVLLPVPFIMISSGFAPPVRILFLASVLGAIAVVDGVQGPMVIFLAVLFAELAIFSALSYLLARIVHRAFERPAGGKFVTPLVALTVVSLLCLSFFEVYRTPHSSSRPYSNIAGLLD